MRENALAKYLKKIEYVNDHLVNGKDFLVGDTFTIADSYLYITLSWVGWVGADISPYTNVTNYYEKIKALPQVIAAHELMATSPTHTN
jgi:glutathione S-transferase